MVSITMLQVDFAHGGHRSQEVALCPLVAENLHLLSGFACVSCCELTGQHVDESAAR